MSKSDTILKLSALAQLVNGTISGKGDPDIYGVAPFDTAGPKQITWAASRAFLSRIEECRAAAVIVPQNFSADSNRLLKVHLPQVAFAQISQMFNPASHPYRTIDQTACIGEDAEIDNSAGIGPYAVVGKRVRIGKRAVIYPHVVIGDDVTIGDEVVIYPHVYIGAGCILGDRIIIHAGTSIGSDGFGFAPDGEIYHKVPQLGIVRIDDDVEIGANNTIDRATFGETRIHEGVKTDNLVHIAHNVVVGAHTVIVAQVGISGSVSIGHHCVFAGQAGVSGHLTIGDHVTLGPQAGLAKSIPSNQMMSGSAAMPHKVWLRVQNIIPKLPDLKKKISTLEKQVEKLTQSKES